VIAARSSEEVHPVKRVALSLGLCALLALASAPASFGFAADFDYVGQVAGQDGSSVGFSVVRSASGRKRVKEFTVTRVVYRCRDAPPGVTDGWAFDGGMRIRSRRFEGKSDWIGLPLDPVGKVSGKLRRGGVAKGSFKIRGELAGPGTHCRTGLVDWRASKNPILTPARAGGPS
jgi:hypothetical protein